MSKKELIQEVEMMGPEERKSMHKIYKIHIVLVSLVIALGVGLMIGIFSHAQSNQNEAKKVYDTYRTHIEYNVQQNIQDFTLYEYSANAIDRYFDMQKLKDCSIFIGFGVILVGIILVWFFLRKKYTDFSWRKYFYLKQLEKEEQEAQEAEEKAKEPANKEDDKEEK